MEYDDKRLQAIEDRAGIAETVAQYSLFILTGSSASIPALFSDDGVFEIASAGLLIKGRAQLTEFYEKMTPGVTFPVVQTATIRIDGNRAEHIGVMLSLPSEARKGYLGLYTDQLVKDGENWLFSERSFRFLQGDPYVKKDPAP